MDPGIPDCIDAALKDGSSHACRGRQSPSSIGNIDKGFIREGKYGDWTTSKNWKRPGFLRLFLRARERARMATLPLGSSPTV